MKKHRLYSLVFVILFVVAVPAWSESSNIAWIDWISATDGALGSASGQIAADSNVSVSYTGEVTADTTLDGSYPSWGPFQTFSGGTVGNSPTIHDIIGLSGGSSATNTITFSTPVINPVIAIWSLGASGTKASFVFSTTNLAIQSGGPNNEYDGTSLTHKSGNVIWGEEGSGTIQFFGTYTKISWTNPQSEGWYGFTVGIPRLAAYTVPQSVALVDLNGNGMPEEATLVKINTNNAIQVLIRDSQTKALLKTVIFLTGSYTPLGLAEVPDINSSGKPEIAMMYRNDITGVIGVIIRDSWTGTLIKNIVFGLVQAKSVTVLKDTDSNGIPEIAVTALIPSTNTYRLDIRDALSGALIRNISLP